MKEKYFRIKADKARELIEKAKTMTHDSRGFDKQVFLFDEYAVLSSSRINLRNVTTKDSDLLYYDELICTLIDLYDKGVAVVPTLGYCVDESSEDGEGFIIQAKAKGEELYDDSIMKELYVDGHYLDYLANDKNPEEYIISRTEKIANAPQTQYDKFIADMLVLLENDALIDFAGKSNFFYDSVVGFQFIDIDSHSDYKYGLINEKIDSKLLASYYGFTPCHLTEESKVRPTHKLKNDVVMKIGTEALKQISSDNITIFAKCKQALLNNGITRTQLNSSLEIIKIFGL